MTKEQLLKEYALIKGERDELLIEDRKIRAELTKCLSSSVNLLTNNDPRNRFYSHDDDVALSWLELFYELGRIVNSYRVDNNFLDLDLRFRSIEKLVLDNLVKPEDKQDENRM